MSSSRKLISIQHYGDVVPEIAARSHIEAINPVIDEALAAANCTWDDIDAIAVTYAPGLVGSLLVGTLAARRTLAIVHNKPLYPIHHVEKRMSTRILSSKTDARTRAIQVLEQSTAQDDEVSRSEAVSRSTRLNSQLELPSKQPGFPMLALIVSGGHTQLVLFQGAP